MSKINRIKYTVFIDLYKITLVSEFKKLFRANLRIDGEIYSWSNSPIMEAFLLPRQLQLFFICML